MRCLSASGGRPSRTSRSVCARLRQVAGLQLRVALECGQADRAEPVQPLGSGVLRARGECVLGMPDQVQRRRVVSAACLAFRFDGIEPRPGTRLRPGRGGRRYGRPPFARSLPPGRSAQPGMKAVCVRMAAPSSGSSASPAACRARRRVCCSLLGLSQVEELDTSGQQLRLGQRGRDGTACCAAVSGRRAQPRRACARTAGCSMAGATDQYRCRCERVTAS